MATSVAEFVNKDTLMRGGPVSSYVATRAVRQACRCCDGSRELSAKSACYGQPADAYEAPRAFGKPLAGASPVCCD